MSRESSGVDGNLDSLTYLASDGNLDTLTYLAPMLLSQHCLKAFKEYLTIGLLFKNGRIEAGM